MKCDYTDKCQYGNGGNGCGSCRYCVRNEEADKARYDNLKVNGDTYSELVIRMLEYATGETAEEKYSMAEKLAKLHVQMERERIEAIKEEKAKKEEELKDKVRKVIEESQQEYEEIKAAIDSENAVIEKENEERVKEYENKRNAFVNEYQERFNEMKEACRTQGEALKKYKEEIKEMCKKYDLSQIHTLYGYDAGVIYDSYVHYLYSLRNCRKTLRSYPNLVYVDGNFYSINTLEEWDKRCIWVQKDRVINPSAVPEREKDRMKDYVSSSF